MNIEEYRAMVAQEAKLAEEETTVKVENVDTEGVETNVQTDENTVAQPEQTVQTSHETNPTPTETVAEETTSSLPEAIEVGGVEVPIEELRQGYLRQSDYTKKTQELARIKSEMETAQKYFDAINTDPEFAEGIARRFDLPFMTPEEARLKKLESDYNSLQLERELDNLKLKYEDIDVQKVVQTAFDEKIPNLENAYLLIKAREGMSENATTNQALDIEAIKEEIRQELKAELQSNVDTSTIIGAGGGGTQQVTSNTPELSPAEMRVVQNMKMTASEYAKWKNMK